jgi:hypothetical protein
MILTVLALGGTILGATTVAGLLMLYQLRQATDLANSAKAIFAADAGLESAFYNLFCPGTGKPCPAAEPVFTPENGATQKVTCYNAAGEAQPACDGDTRTIHSVGSAGGASRAFEATF